LLRTAKAIVLSIGLLAANSPSRATDLLVNVPEASAYQLVYEFSIPIWSLGWNSTTVPYTVNNSALIPTGSFDRVAYYLELVQNSGPTQWVYVSMNTFTNRADKLGVPNTNSGEYYRYGTGGNMPSGWVANASIFASSGSGIATGTAINTINLEFWPSNYGSLNGYGVPGASATMFDFGDGASGTSAGHGSMQIHNYGTGQTLFAYNAWGGARTSELGIANQSVGNRDWTFNTTNITTFSSRTLQVLVQPIPEPSTELLVLGGILVLCHLARRSSRL
jgi:hypothetical protein